MIEFNPQKPFAFQASYDRHKRKLIIHKPYLAKNIAGCCPFCGRMYQKIRKFDKEGNKLDAARCRACLALGYDAHLFEFPKEMRPWKIHIDNNNHYCIGNYCFNCTKCMQRMFSWAVLGALCDHKTHLPPKNFVCRLCCTKVVENPIAPSADIPVPLEISGGRFILHGNAPIFVNEEPPINPNLNDFGQIPQNDNDLDLAQLQEENFRFNDDVFDPLWAEDEEQF